MDSQAQDPIASLFLDYSSRKLESMTANLASCMNRLGEEQIWRRGGPHENAVGNLILHLCGNMRQWIMHGVDRQPDVRVRELEFSTTGGLSRDELLALFRTTVAEARAILAALPAERLTDRTNPQPTGQTGEVSVLDAIYQVVGHVQQHVGQIILLTKQMAGTDLDLSMPRPR
jgi:uncharacterized damage-inducible protein DinB